MGVGGSGFGLRGRRGAAILAAVTWHRRGVVMLEQIGILLSILVPLVAVPLTVITFYLRSLREHQLTRQQELAQRLDEQTRAWEVLRRSVAEFERDYTTKEEWLRECLHARRVLERLTVVTAGLEASAVARRQSGDELRSLSDAMTNI